jgi:hypothetical protein
MGLSIPGMKGTIHSTGINGDPCGGIHIMIRGSHCWLLVIALREPPNSSWWDWEDGSRPFFWRWSVEYQNQIRDGIPLWYRGTAPRKFLSQRKETDPEVRQSMGANLMKLFARRYFIYGMILSLTSFFAIPKGDTGIHLVYNGTSSGLNVHLWAPLFTLPTMCALLRALEIDTFMADSDIGEFFLNFMLEEICERLAGNELHLD